MHDNLLLATQYDEILTATPRLRGILACLGLVFLIQGCAYTGSKTAIVACQAFDTWTTLRGLELGATEAGFVGDTPGQVLITKSVITGLFVYLRSENIIDDKAATAVNVITCGAAIHNLHVIEKQKQINEQRTGSTPVQATRGLSIGIRF